MSFFDVVGGFTLSLRSRRRDLAIESVAPVPETVERAPDSAEHAPTTVERYARTRRTRPVLNLSNNR